MADLCFVDVRGKVNELLNGGTPILASAVCDTGSEQIPVVRLDGQRRPDIADLGRVLGQEGAIRERLGEWRFATDGDHIWWVFEWATVRPVACRFRLVFDFDADRDFLERMVEHGAVAFTTEPLRFEQGMYLTKIRFDRGELTWALSFIKRRRG